MACARPGRLANAQVGSRPIGVIMGLETTAHPFAAHPAWLEMRKLSPAERHQRLAADAELRRRLLEQPAGGGPRAFMAESFHKMFPVGERPDYEPDAENSVAAIARRSGRTPQAVALEEMMARGGKGLLMLPFENYAYGSLDVVHEMITDPATVLGVADGGAHVGVICDASSPTSLLTLWGRDRTRGPRLPLEFLVAKQTRGTAEAYGLLDRGLLAPGHKADINVIDFDALSLKRPEVVYDLPAGGRRLIQRAVGLPPHLQCRRRDRAQRRADRRTAGAAGAGRAGRPLGLCRTAGLQARLFVFAGSAPLWWRILFGARTSRSAS